MNRQAKNNEELLMINARFLTRFYEMFNTYKKLIPEELKIAINGIDISSDEDIEELARNFSYAGITVENIRNFINLSKLNTELTKIKESFEAIREIKKEYDDVSDLVAEYNTDVQELNSMFESYLTEEERKTNPSELLSAKSLLVFGSKIEESRKRTMESKSGKTTESMKSICAVFKAMTDYEYQQIRQKGVIHQVQDPTRNKGVEIDGLAVERMGTGTSKVIYLRLPVTESNKEKIQRQLGRSEIDNIYLIMDFGDFHNESISEKQLYRDAFFRIKKDEEMYTEIISLFGKDFTGNKEKEAMALIERGAEIVSNLSKEPRKELTTSPQSSL